MDVSKNTGGPPKWMVYHGNLSKMDDLGVPQETPIYIAIVPKRILPETNIEFTPKNLWLEDEVPLGKLRFLQGLC